MDWTLDVVSAGGRRWRLVEHMKNYGIAVEKNSQSGFVGSSSDVVFQQVGRDGVRRGPTGVLDQMIGDLTLVVCDRDDIAAGDLWAQWLADWREPVSLQFTTSSGMWQTEARMADGFRPAVWDFQPQPKTSSGNWGNGHVKVPWSAVADSGAWWQTHTETAGVEQEIVTVTNFGEAICTPVIEWEQAGTVIPPSGASFDLPAVDGRRRLVLDVNENYLVTDMDGVIDRPTWEAVRGNVFASPIFPGHSEEWWIPPKSMLVWEVGVKNPWR